MAWDFCNLRAAYWTRYSVPSRPQSALFQMVNSLTRGFSWIALHWRTSAVIACAAIGIAATTRRYLETDEARVHREQRNRKKELRALADKISTYGRKVHQRYPTGDVVVSERDLAEQLRKHPDIVATALRLLAATECRHAHERVEWKARTAPLLGVEVARAGTEHGNRRARSCSTDYITPIRLRMVANCNGDTVPNARVVLNGPDANDPSHNRDKRKRILRIPRSQTGNDISDQHQRKRF